MNRLDAIVICTCGWNAGSSIRAQADALKEERTELDAVSARVPLMVRHWQLGHTLKLGPNAPMAALPIIKKAAEQLHSAM